MTFDQVCVVLTYVSPLPNECGIIPNALSPTPVVIADNEGEVEVVPNRQLIPLGGSIASPNLDSSVWNEGLHVRRTGAMSVDFDPLSPGESYSVEQILAMFTFVNVEITGVYALSGGHVWLDYVCAICELLADVNGDGTVNMADLLTVASEFGCIAGLDACSGDLNGDGATNAADLLILNAEFGSSCPDTFVSPLSAPPPPNQQTSPLKEEAAAQKMAPSKKATTKPEGTIPKK